MNQPHLVNTGRFQQRYPRLQRDGLGPHSNRLCYVTRYSCCLLQVEVTQVGRRAAGWRSAHERSGPGQNSAPLFVSCMSTCTYMPAFKPHYLGCGGSNSRSFILETIFHHCTCARFMVTSVASWNAGAFLRCLQRKGKHNKPHFSLLKANKYPEI